MAAGVGAGVAAGASLELRSLNHHGTRVPLFDRSSVGAGSGVAVGGGVGVSMVGGAGVVVVVDCGVAVG